MQGSEERIEVNTGQKGVKDNLNYSTPPEIPDLREASLEWYTSMGCQLSDQLLETEKKTI